MSKSTFAHEVETHSIAGYDYGRTGVARSPVSLTNCTSWRPPLDGAPRMPGRSSATESCSKIARSRWWIRGGR